MNECDKVVLIGDSKLVPAVLDVAEASQTGKKGRRAVTGGMARPARSNRSTWREGGVTDRWMARFLRAAGCGPGLMQLSGSPPADKESDGGWETISCRGP